MEIKDLVLGNIDVVEGTIISISVAKSINKYGKNLKVADAVLEDITGTIKLSLWNDEITNFKIGDTIRVTDGYISEFKEEKQITAGRDGKIEKIEVI